MRILSVLFVTMISLSAWAQDPAATGGAPAAQGGLPGGAAGAPPVGDMLTQWLMMMAMIFGVFYFLLIRPQQRQRKEQEAKIEALAKGDRIVTSGGLLGTIIGTKDNIAVIKIAENVKVEVLKSAISQVLGKDEKAQ